MIRSSISAALLTAMLTTTAIAAPLLVDRGLPTANLNNAAGGSRSNVDWLNPGLLTGDTFTNTSSQTWSISTIRLWTDGANETAILWGGVAGSIIGVVSPTGAITGGGYLREWTRIPRLWGRFLPLE